MIKLFLTYFRPVFNCVNSDSVFLSSFWEAVSVMFRKHKIPTPIIAVMTSSIREYTIPYEPRSIPPIAGESNDIEAEIVLFIPLTRVRCSFGVI